MPDYRAALATRSSYVENVLTHSMISEHYRDIPRSRLRKLPSVSDLLDALFPNAASQPAETSQVSAPALAG